MIDINKLIKDIEQSGFVLWMELSDIQKNNTILIDNVERIFINPTNIEFKGFYEQTK